MLHGQYTGIVTAPRTLHHLHEQDRHKNPCQIGHGVVALRRTITARVNELVQQLSHFYAAISVFENTGGACRLITTATRRVIFVREPALCDICLRRVPRLLSFNLRPHLISFRRAPLLLSTILPQGHEDDVLYVRVPRTR